LHRRRLDGGEERFWELTAKTLGAWSLRLRAWGWVAESLILGVERKRQFGVKSLGLAAGSDRGEERF
jgi:hypothetical protein